MTIARHAAMAGLWRQAVDLAESLDTQAWGRQVPWTPAWTVADLVSHLSGLQSMMNGESQPAAPAPVEVTEGGSPFDHAMAGTVAARRGWTPAQRLDELHRVSEAHVATLAATTDWLEETQGPVGTTTKDGLFRVRAFDVWVHLQDLREALGLPVDVDDASDGAAAAHQYVLGLVPWMFAKRVGASEGATLRVTLGPPLDHDSVLAVVQRRATWDPTADPGEDLVNGSPGALTLLVAGRGTAQRWRHAGALAWAGARGGQFAERARLF
ncbi:MAG: maleylpyruvate isomerase family mycothiol-dependent enzyme [Nitriliruptorales bacterium]|nr:maleylpyruvate isomerase family mycothiol-dependent enzyme [Nitriliruptorales bacterium]